MKTALYRHYDADGVLLYVGITDDWRSRTAAHGWNSDWFDSVAKSTVEWCLNRQHAAALEKVAIRYERPRHNKTHNSEAENETDTSAVAPGPNAEAVNAMRRFEATFNVKPTSIGQLAVNNRNAYERLVAGTAHHTTADAIIKWVEAETERRLAAQAGAA